MAIRIIRLATFAALCLCGGLAAAQTAGPVLVPAAAGWPTPDPETLPKGPQRDIVLYGRDLIVETDKLMGPRVANSAMRYSGNNMTCQNCHLSAGTKRFALPLIGVYGAFPAYMARENEVRTLEDRINGCMERSMNGKALPLGGREMKSLLAYIAFVSAGVPVGTTIVGRGSPTIPLLTRAADPVRGEGIYRAVCAVCHGPDGAGKPRAGAGKAHGYEFPPLWGADSFNDGAGMHRLIASAAFIRANMPFGTASDVEPVLSVEDAWDVAAFVNSRPRPIKANLDRDYPDRTRKPPDAPFPPFVDQFPLAQHRWGPFQPIIYTVKRSSPSN